MRPDPTSLTEALDAAIEACGYFPALVQDSVRLSLGAEPVVSFAVQHEPTITPDGIHRHLTVAVLTPTRLVINHTDDAESGVGAESGEAAVPGPQAASTSEVVALGRIVSVSMSRIIGDPAHYRPYAGGLQEVLLTVAWGFASRVELEPATCGDPSCEADHGLSGQLVGDDLVMRMSAEADGAAAVDRLVEFGVALQRRTGR